MRHVPFDNDNEIHVIIYLSYIMKYYLKESLVLLVNLYSEVDRTCTVLSGLFFSTFLSHINSDVI